MGVPKGCDNGSWNLVDAGTQEPLGRFTLVEVLWNRLGL